MDQSPAIVINDPGGLVWEHVGLGKHYAQTGARLIVFYCASACLDLIAQVPRDKVCFRRSAWVGYHTVAQRRDGTEATYTMRWERGKDWIKKGYAECK